MNGPWVPRHPQQLSPQIISTSASRTGHRSMTAAPYSSGNSMPCFPSSSSQKRLRFYLILFYFDYFEVYMNLEWWQHPSWPEVTADRLLTWCSTLTVLCLLGPCSDHEKVLPPYRKHIGRWNWIHHSSTYGYLHKTTTFPIFLTDRTILNDHKDWFTS